MDLAIQGNGFFAVSDTLATYYTRDGAFGLRRRRLLVVPSTGFGCPDDTGAQIQPR
ncbi:MAG: hypothetical protein R3A46_18580 [Thermomicrobiales bacterium]